MLKKWKKISSQLVSENPWWKYYYHTVIMPNGKEGEYHVIDLQGSVVVIPLHDDKTITMVKQFRYPIFAESLEFPMGGVGGDEYDVAAHRELIEECGLDGDLECVGSFHPANALLTELSKVYIARNVRENTSLSADECEEFEYFRYTPEEIDALIERGEITDAFTITAWTLARNKV
jgi:ADP-ribose pyrophosphatase